MVDNQAQMEMAQPRYDPDIIFKALRLVPDFDGNPNILTRFIRLCDELVRTYTVLEGPGADLNNLSLLNGILNKITGNAARTINSNGIPSNWIGIRNVLINNFSDQRDETALYNDLSMQTQGNSSPQEFYDRCQTLFSTLMTYITLHEHIPTTIEAKRDLYRKLTLKSYVRGLKEPLGSRIRCMRPDTIEKALEYVQEEMNIMYLAQRNEGPVRNQFPHVTNKIPPASFTNPMMSLPKPFVLPPFAQQVSHWQRPIAQPSPMQFRSNNAQYNNSNRMPTRTQQMFRAPPPNYNANSNAFRLPQRSNFSNNFTPKPMSGVQHFVSKPMPLTGHDWRRHGNPPPTNYFKSRDVNVNDCWTYDNNFDYHNCTAPYDYDSYTDYGPNYDVCYGEQIAYGTDSGHCYDNELLSSEQLEQSQQADDDNITNEDFQQASTSKKLG